MPVLGDRHVHHHGMLAGLGAGALAVLVAAAFLASVWHRVSGTVAEALTVIVWLLVAAFVAAVAAWFAYLYLRLRHHAADPETLTWHTVRAEVLPPSLPAAESPAVPAAAPTAELPAPSTHYRFDSPEAVEAALRAISRDERN